VDPDGTPRPFTIIFEYGVGAQSNADVKKWAQDWHDLSQLPLGPAFNAVLQNLTDKLAKPVCSGRPNNSCLNQLRTNEVPLSPQKIWELREFRLSAQTGKLVETVTMQTPDASLNGAPNLADFINQNEPLVKQRKHTLTPSLLAASVPASLTTFWSAPGINDNEARFGFAISTCNGCHTAETGSKFLHVKNRQAGAESALSDYMTGVTVSDPVSAAPRTFNEIASRVADMQLVMTSDPTLLFSAALSDNGGGE
jgi:hypothetical protein